MKPKIGRPRIHANQADRQRAYRRRKAEREGKTTKPRLQNQPKKKKPAPRLPANFKPVDTRQWSWRTWCPQFLSKFPFDHQVEDLETFDSIQCLLNNPRQYGKSSFTVQPFITRKLCESQFYHKDRPFLYMSHSNKNVRKIIRSTKRDLVLNNRIINTYGELVDNERMLRGYRASQTQYELNLKTLKDPFLTSLVGGTVEGGIRGDNYYYVMIDDPIDFKEVAKRRETIIKATEDFMTFFKNKILPLAKGIIIVIGTRYGTDDIYARLKKMRIFKHHERGAIKGVIPGYTVPAVGTKQQIEPKDLVINDPVDILAPQLWATQHDAPLFNGTPAQNIMFRHYIMGERAFQQEYQNNPLPENRALKIEWIREYDKLPIEPHFLSHAVTVDTSAGESQAADYNAFAYVVSYKRNYYIIDLKHGKWSPLEKVKQLEAFVENCATLMGLDKTAIEVRIEVVRTSGMDFYRLLLEHSWIAAKKSTPVGRGKKQDRIANNFGGEAEVGRVWINRECRFTNVLVDEMDAFPFGKHDHYLDAIDQAVWYLKLSGTNPLEGFTPKTFSGYELDKKDNL
jgi:phage terminase large subunit-like protein